MKACSDLSFFVHFMMILLMLISSSFMQIMPILDTVAGEANCKLSDQKMKLTFEPNDIRYPVGKVRRWLSSSTEFRAQIHYGSTSPSQMIQFKVYWSSFTTYLAETVKTPYENYRVSLFIWPRKDDRGIALGFIRCILTVCFNFSQAFFKVFQIVVLPHPEGPTKTDPILCLVAS